MEKVMSTLTSESLNWKTLAQYPALISIKCVDTSDIQATKTWRYENYALCVTNCRPQVQWAVWDNFMSPLTSHPCSCFFRCLSCSRRFLSAETQTGLAEFCMNTERQTGKHQEAEGEMSRHDTRSKNNHERKEAQDNRLRAGSEQKSRVTGSAPSVSAHTG